MKKAFQAIGMKGFSEILVVIGAITNHLATRIDAGFPLTNRHRHAKALALAPAPTHPRYISACSDPQYLNITGQRTLSAISFRITVRN
jgi:hypothetical protein